MANRPFTCTLNGRMVAADIWEHETLLDVLRDRFGLDSVRESCGQGVCGSCTVTVGEHAVSSCLLLASQAADATITTAEGLSASPDHLHPIAEAFIDAFAFQCGFCTPGMVMMASALLEEQPDPDEEEIRRYMAGNLCRCGCYPEIVEAVRQAAETLRRRGRTPSGDGRSTVTDDQPSGQSEVGR